VTSSSAAGTRDQGLLARASAISTGRVGRPERFFLLTTYAAFICLRMPDVLLKGRFWGKEGPVFFVHAWTLPWHEALLAPWVGYLNIVATSAGLLARNLANMLAQGIAADLQSAFRAGDTVLWAPLITVAVFCLFAAALVLRRRMDLIWLFAAGCCLTVVTYYGALADLVGLISPEAGNRYHHVPQAVFALVVLGLAATGARHRGKALVDRGRLAHRGRDGRVFPDIGAYRPWPPFGTPK
jgi:hypothetical protein